MSTSWYYTYSRTSKLGQELPQGYRTPRWIRPQQSGSGVLVWVCIIADLVGPLRVEDEPLRMTSWLEIDIENLWALLRRDIWIQKSVVWGDFIAERLTFGEDRCSSHCFLVFILTFWAVYYSQLKMGNEDERGIVFFFISFLFIYFFYSSVQWLISWLVFLIFQKR